MEKKSSSSFMKNQLSTIKEINSTNLSEEDFLSLFSWPPRSYTCTFCKREFRSAQALGGHMNVHRRDRARLRQLAPLHHAHLNLNLDPNPSFICFNSCNPSFSSAAAAKVVPQSLMIPPSVSTISTTPPATVSDHRVKWGRADFAQDLMVKTKELAARRFFELEKLANSGDEIVKMELNFGMISEVKEDDHHVDLELRLGYV